MMIKVTGTDQKTERQEESRAVSSPFRLFEDVFNAWAMRNAFERRQEAWTPPADILDDADKLIIRLEIPGLSESDVDLRLDGRTLTVRGERKPDAEADGFTYHRVEGSYGNFSRSFELPASIDSDRVAAAVRNGVLTITLPQKPEVKPRSIQVTKG